LKARFYCGSAEELSLLVPVQPFDLIYSFGVIHHTPHPDKVFAELKKYCGPATELRLMLYAMWSWKVFSIIAKHGKGAFWRAEELVRKYSEAQTGCPVTYFYSRQDARKLLKDFHVLRIGKDHIFAYKVGKYIQYEYEREWYFRRIPEGLFGWLQRCLGWHLLIVAKPKAVSS
jgi:SAM-dependent methyltransferase